MGKSIDITIMSIEADSPLHPLWKLYSGQVTVQPAYIELDLENGTMEVGYSGEIGGGVPMRVWNQIVRRFPVSPRLTHKEINQLMNDILPDCQRLLDTSEVEWDGSNYVGRPAEGQDAGDWDDLRSKVERTCEECNTSSNGVWDAEDWFHGGGIPEAITAVTTDEELQAIIEDEQLNARLEDATVPDLAEFLTEKRDEKKAE